MPASREQLERDRAAQSGAPDPDQEDTERAAEVEQGADQEEARELGQ